jgi:hypothetical protein
MGLRGLWASSRWPSSIADFSLFSYIANPEPQQTLIDFFGSCQKIGDYIKHILCVMRLLGHKNITNTLVYTQLIEFKEDEFVCEVDKTVQEASELIENGFEFICAFDDAKLFRKRK